VIEPPLGSNVTCLVTSDGLSPNELMIPVPVTTILLVSTLSSSGAMSTVEAHGMVTEGASPSAHSQGTMATDQTVHEQIATQLELQGPLEEAEQRFEQALMMYAAARSIRSLLQTVQTQTRFIEGVTREGGKFNPDRY
jgi:hypothetical protein